jgi:hypothetical protein
MTLETKKHVQLPLFDDTAALPTGKMHISYSELFDHLECSFKHKLKHIDKIDLDGPSIHTEYGQVLHDVLESFLLTKTIPGSTTILEAVLKFKELVAPLVETGKAKPEEVEEFAGQMPAMISAVPGWMDETFPGWEPVAAEFYLFEKIKEQTKESRYFKGFIDAVIRVPKKVRKTKKVLLSEVPTPVEYDIVILDWKTTSWGWPTERKRDFNKQLQLMLYKHFWCEKFGLDLKDVKCGFVLLKRTAKEGTSPCELVPVSVGPVALARSLQTMNSMINMVRGRRAIKNRYSCRFCQFSNTVHCP